jgi:hypothetical protein
MASQWRLPGIPHDGMTWRVFGRTALDEQHSANAQVEMSVALEYTIGRQLLQRYSAGLCGYEFLAPPAEYNASELADNVDMLTADIREYRALIKCVRAHPQFKPDWIPSQAYALFDRISAARDLMRNLLICSTSVTADI